MHRLYAVLLLAIALVTDVCVLGIPTTKITSYFSVKLVQPPVSSRLLRVHHEERSSEERGVPVSTVEKLIGLFSAAKVSDETLQLWLKSGKSADNVFIRLKLDTAASDKLFESPQFNTWIKYADELYSNKPQKGVSTISTLTSYYGNQELAQMIITAQKNPSTKALATELQVRQIKYWLSDKTKPADVLKWLMLNKAGDKLVENPQFLTWLAYADDFQKLRRKTQSRISILTASYGDEALSKMLIEGNKIPIAAKLQSEQIQRWMTSQASPSDVFRFLMLNKAGDSLLGNPQFLTWVQYVDDLNKVNLDKKTTIMSVLGTYYSSSELTKMLEAAAPSKLVKRLEGEQKWLGKDTPDELFKKLKLDKAGDELLDKPQFKTWVTYMKEFNIENPKYQTTLVATLVKNYGDGVLVKILEAAKGVKSTASTAKRLQSEHIQLWLTNGYTPDDIFKVLKLDMAGDNLLTNSLLPTWMKYLDLFNLEYPTKKTTLVTTLTRNKYSEKTVVQLLEAVKNVASAKTVATKLQAELYEYWLAAKRYPADVFSMLRLNKAGDGLLSNPKFTFWTQYSDDFYVKFPDEGITMMRTLYGYYDDIHLARMIEAALKSSSTQNAAKRLEGELFNKWAVESYPPEFIFTSLELQKAGKTLLENPLLSTWSRYVIDFNKRNNTPAKKASVSKILTEFYTKDELLKLIEMAKKDASTEKLATDLGHALLNGN